MDLSKKNVMVVDHGLFCEFASVLARTFGKVWYCPFHTDSYPSQLHGGIGTGIDGLTVVQSPFDIPASKIDLWCFTDVGFGSMQRHLVDTGATVFGSRMGEELELERGAVKDMMKNMGLPVNPWRRIVGIANLRAWLKENERQHVKTEHWRGDCESFFSENYRTSETRVDELEHKLGAFKYIAEFIVEDDLPDCVEAGTDCITVDGQFPEETFCGIEIKDAAFAGSMMDWKKIPEPVTRINTALAPILKRYQYRGPMSTEVRIDKKKNPYCIDLTCRLPSPPNEIDQELYVNLAEKVWEAAHGNMTPTKTLAKFGCQVMMRSKGAWADKNWVPFDIKPKHRKNVKLLYPAKIDGRFYCIPQGEESDIVGSVIGWGDTLEAARKMVKEVADDISAISIKIPVDVLDEAEGELKKSEDMGMNLV